MDQFQPDLQTPAPGHHSLTPAATEAPLATPAELATPNTFFFGRFGLRAGYGILIWIVAFAIFTVIAGVAAMAVTGHLHEIMAAQAYAKAHPGAPKPALHFPMVPLQTIVQDGVWFFGILGVCWFFHKAERRPMRSFGIGTYRAIDVVPGALWGLLIMTALIGVLRGLHLLVFDSVNVHGVAAVAYGFKWLIAFLLVGLAEEYTFRGYLQYTLMRGVWGLAERLSPTAARPVAFWTAAGILSLGFAAVHTGNGGETFFGLVQVFFAGMAFAYALWRTGSLWWGIGFHATWDWAQSFLFGVADSGTQSFGRLFNTHPQGAPLLSGGTTGPEGSVFATVALALTIVIVHFTARPGMQPALEQEPKPAPTPAGGFHNVPA